jgi:hypothetical protein
MVIALDLLLYRRPNAAWRRNCTPDRKQVFDFKGAVGAYFGLLSGLRRPPDLGYYYRRIFPQKVAFGT